MVNPPMPPPNSVRAIALIRAEHRALARMLAAMQALLALYRNAGGERDFGLFDAMLCYIENVPDKLHHPKEDGVLFPPLVQRVAAGRKLVEELEREHVRGEPMIAGLREAFQSFRHGTPKGLDLLSAALDDYTKFYLRHMGKEELQLLPLAIAHFTTEEWQRVEKAFGDHTDPLFGAELADDYRRLYECISELTPTPIKPYLEGTASGFAGE